MTNSVVSRMYRRVVSALRPFMIISAGFLIIGIAMILLMLFPSVSVALIMMIMVGVGIGPICPALSNTLAGEATSSTSGKIIGGFSTFLNFGQFTISLVSVPSWLLLAGTSRPCSR